MTDPTTCPTCGRPDTATEQTEGATPATGSAEMNRLVRLPRPPRLSVSDLLARSRRPPGGDAA